MRGLKHLFERRHGLAHRHVGGRWKSTRMSALRGPGRSAVSDRGPRGRRPTLPGRGAAPAPAPAPGGRSPAPGRAGGRRTAPSRRSASRESASASAVAVPSTRSETGSSFSSTPSPRTPSTRQPTTTTRPIRCRRYITDPNSLPLEEESMRASCGFWYAPVPRGRLGAILSAKGRGSASAAPPESSDGERRGAERGARGRSRAAARASRSRPLAARPPRPGPPSAMRCRSRYG